MVFRLPSLKSIINKARSVVKAAVGVATKLPAVAAIAKAVEKAVPVVRVAAAPVLAVVTALPSLRDVAKSSPPKPREEPPRPPERVTTPRPPERVTPVTPAAAVPSALVTTPAEPVATIPALEPEPEPAAREGPLDALLDVLTGKRTLLEVLGRKDVQDQLDSLTAEFGDDLDDDGRGDVVIFGGASGVRIAGVAGRALFATRGAKLLERLKSLLPGRSAKTYDDVAAILEKRGLDNYHDFILKDPAAAYRAFSKASVPEKASVLAKQSRTAQGRAALNMMFASGTRTTLAKLRGNPIALWFAIFEAPQYLLLLTFARREAPDAVNRALQLIEKDFERLHFTVQRQVEAGQLDAARAIMVEMRRRADDYQRLVTAGVVGGFSVPKILADEGTLDTHGAAVESFQAVIASWEAELVAKAPAVRPATLKISTNVIDPLVLINGTPRVPGSGLTFSLPAGTYEVEVRKEPRHKPRVERSVRLAEGEELVLVMNLERLPDEPAFDPSQTEELIRKNAALKADLASLPGTLHVLTNAPGVQVLVADLELGVTDANGGASFTLTPGVYSVTFRKAGFLEERRNVLVISQASQTAAVTLSPLTAKRKLWRVDVTARDPLGNPLTPKILVNGVFTGLFAPDFVLLEPGQYAFRLEKSGFLPAEQRVVLEAIP